jgi:redox-sensitive bicupin YhaK (pirin superfamily)
LKKDGLKVDHAEDHPTEAEIDRTLAESFPASDPPGWTLGLEQTGAPTDQRQSEGASASLETVIVTRVRDLVGGFKVRRALPSSRRRMVGPFIFLDQMGPEMLRANTGLDVAPHPHIGLATVTYLFEGDLLHRDSLGVVQPIRPGEVNWMTAGKGIVHSERTPQEMRQMGSKLFGIQSWVALPQRDEETDPAFAHHGADELPVIEGEGKRVRLISGSLYGARSPVRTLSEMFYADVTIEEGARLLLPVEHEERAAYVVEGSVELIGDGGTFDAGQLLVFKPGEEITLRAPESSPVRVMLLGREPMDVKRHIWWNFVSSSRERIEQAKEDWQAGRFAPVPGETEFIPLPEKGPAIVRYP